MKKNNRGDNVILDIFKDAWKVITDTSDKVYDFIMKSYDQPFFWIILFCVLLIITTYAISNLANK